MANYRLKVPFTGYVEVGIVADNEEDAERNVFESDLDFSDAVEVEFHNKIVQGNVFYGVLNELEIEEVD